MEFPGRCTRIEERLAAGANGKRATARKGAHDALRTHVRAAGDPHNRGKFTASERSGGAKQRGTSRSPGKEAAAQGDLGLRSCECVLGSGLSS